MGIDTKTISPLGDYVQGLVILTNMFSRSFIQDMFYGTYKNNNRRFLGIKALEKYTKQFKKPIYILDGESIRKLDEKENELLSFMILLTRNPNIKFQKAFYQIVEKYQIKGHLGEPITSDGLDRRKKANLLTLRINSYLTRRQTKNVNVDKLKEIIKWCIEKMGYGDNYSSEIMYLLEKHNLFHPTTEPVVWMGIMDDLIDGESLEELEKILSFYENREKHKRESYDSAKTSDYWLDKMRLNNKHTKSQILDIGGF